MFEDEHHLEGARCVLVHFPFSLSLSPFSFPIFELEASAYPDQSISYHVLHHTIIDYLDTLFFSLYLTSFSLFPNVRGRTFLRGGQMWQCRERITTYCVCR